MRNVASTRHLSFDLVEMYNMRQTVMSLIFLNAHHYDWVMDEHVIDLFLLWGLLVYGHI
jgi:hypothetical protein